MYSGTSQRSEQGVLRRREKRKIAQLFFLFFKVRTLTKAEIDKLHADAAKESIEEKAKIAAFVERYKLEHGGATLGGPSV